MAAVRTRLLGRDSALDAVDTLLDRLRGELSTETSGPAAGATDRTLLLLGEPGIGKTSLLEFAAGRVRDQPEPCTTSRGCSTVHAVRLPTPSP